MYTLVWLHRETKGKVPGRTAVRLNAHISSLKSISVEGHAEELEPRRTYEHGN